MLLDRENTLTRKIIGCCFEVHSKLGTGFDEKTYHKALIEIFKRASINFDTEKTYPVFFENTKIGFKRLDLIIENRLIVEVKAVKGYLPDIYRQQLTSYLKLTKLCVGLLVNFGNNRCVVKRYLNDPPIRAIR